MPRGGSTSGRRPAAWPPCRSDASGQPPIGWSAQHEVEDQVGVDVCSQPTGVDSAAEDGEEGGAPWNQVVLVEPVKEFRAVGNSVIRMLGR